MRGRWAITGGAAALLALLAGLTLTPHPAQAATFTVNDSADTADGSCDPTSCTLREAILAANGSMGADAIAFAIGSGVVTIAPADALPQITDPVDIDGTTQPGFAGTPIVELDGSGAGAGADGLWLGAGSSSVRGLVIRGFDGVGVRVESDDNTIGGAIPGDGNVIAGNSDDGVQVGLGVGNAILANSIHANGGLGIDLGPDGVTLNDALDADMGANELQNFPILTLAVAQGGTTRVQGALGSSPNTEVRVELFSSAECDATGWGEGESFLGAALVTTDGAGNAALDETLVVSVPLDDSVTATATDPAGNTSEFGSCVPVPEPAARVLRLTALVALGLLAGPRRRRAERHGRAPRDRHA